VDNDADNVAADESDDAYEDDNDDDDDLDVDSDNDDKSGGRGGKDDDCSMAVVGITVSRSLALPQASNGHIKTSIEVVKCNTYRVSSTK